MIRQKKYDAVIEAVHYTPEGQIDWVRGYERRGFIFTDMLVFHRQDLLERLENGDRIYLGERKALMGNDFTLGQAVRLESQHIVAGKAQGSRDFLEGAPIF